MTGLSGLDWMYNTSVCLLVPTATFCPTTQSLELPVMLRWGRQSALVAQTAVRSSRHDGVARLLDASTKPPVETRLTGSGCNMYEIGWPSARPAGRLAAAPTPA
ncbi:hypothetical protein GGI43DRAFT_93865 [Trichoderma evansii]